MHRRTFLGSLVATFTLATFGCGATASKSAASPRPSGAPQLSDDQWGELTEEQWAQRLTAQQRYVLREQGTERAFTGEFWDHHEDGVYTCAGCGLDLYESKTKFESGTGWPSYWAPVSESAIATTVDRAWGMQRTEVHCARCSGHLGHIFDDGPKPTGQRHCINSVSLGFRKRSKGA